MKINDILKFWLYKYYFALTLVLICLIGFFDYITGWELQFFIFYFLPIALSAWLGSFILGFITCVISIFTWCVLDILAGHLYTSIYIFIWNTAIRFIVFILFALFLSRIKNYQERIKDSMNFIIHDLITPLVTISMGINNLEDLRSLDSSQKDIVTICKLAAQRGITLINSILDLARLESGKMQLEIKNTDINEVVTSSLEIVSIYAKNKKVALINKTESIPANFFTDYLLLSRILVNLLSNAIKASAEGNTVSLQVKGVDHNVIFSVRDQGKGFPASSVPNAYKKFTQFHRRKKGDMAGSGLGLSFCNLAVAKLGGRIEIKSQEKTGTEVTFILPNKNSA